MKQHRLFLYALAPTHIGAHDDNPGRVDKRIIRDATTQLPIIPGRLIHDTTRWVTRYVLANANEIKSADGSAQSPTVDEQQEQLTQQKQQALITQLYGDADNEADGTANTGIVYFHDAQILALPVRTSLGPRWVTTAQLLRAAGCEQVPEVPSGIYVLVQFTAAEFSPQMNLGWLLLSSQKAEIPLPEGLTTDFKDQLVLVHDDLFSTIVSSNLEIRMLVPKESEIETRTERFEKAPRLTYEAVPRGTLYFGQIDIEENRFPELDSSVQPLVEQTVQLACHVGLGDLTTEGFGRMQPTMVER